VALELLDSGTMTAIYDRAFDELLEEAVAFHGHLCPGQVLGVRMTVAGCRALGVAHPRRAGKRLVVFVEIDRCATDAIQALTGVSLGKRTLKHVDYGKAAATFVDTATREAARVAARDAARELAGAVTSGEQDPRRAQIAAYAIVPEDRLLRLERVTIRPGWLDRRRRRVFCAQCGEGVNYEREVRTGGRVLCRGCAGESYYAVIEAAPGPMTAVITPDPARPDAGTCS
jgi:formylmethanofuran dehydrogenase subunit E